MSGEKEKHASSFGDDDNDSNFASLSRSQSSDSVSLNGFEASSAANDVQGIALLRQIFPNESTGELRRLHQERLRGLSSAAPSRPSASTARNQERTKSMLEVEDAADTIRQIPRRLQEFALPHDFLRIPPEKAVRRYNEDTDRWHYEMVTELEKRALRQHERAWPRDAIGEGQQYYTKVVFRDSKVGLGMTLSEEGGFVAVHSLTSRDGRQWLASPSPKEVANGPAIRVGVEPGDFLIGLNGTALLQSISLDEGLLQHAVSAIRLSPDPIVLHLRRRSLEQIHTTPGKFSETPPSIVSLRFNEMTPSLLDTSDIINESRSVELSFESERCFHSTPMILEHTKEPAIHSFVASLASYGLINKTIEEQLSNTRKLKRFTERTRQWEATSSFHIGDAYAGSETFVPLHGIRKAICARIVNTFLDGDRSAFTIWVYDVESGREWYAPIRYFRDFQDLRAATLPLCSSISSIRFPKQALSLFGSPVRETPTDRETMCRQLEYFLRTLCAMIYREKLHPAVAEIAVHVQSFLGCDNSLFNESLSSAVVGPIGSEGQTTGQDHTTRVRLFLKRSIQRYTYRLFLLDSMGDIVDRFVDAVRASGPRLENIEALEAQGRSVLKARAMKDLERIQAFLDQFQDLIMEGCLNDFTSIAEREDYESLHPLFAGDKGETYWDRLVREAVREQIEIEIYVPVRSMLSRWLVNGWRHEDMEVAFKIKELRKRPQDFFRIPDSKMSPTQWSSVSSILKEGVGLSTLPCAKLRAIVEAAREISRLYSIEHDVSEHPVHSRESHLGADDFLPIFIFCVIKAEMERPCALCVLLRTLCDRINRIGEIGYYLASFEAAISHIQELDLTEEREEMLSFLSVPLNDD
jgi:hypothetical protein